MLYRLSYMSATLSTVERVAGIEPAYSAWKADVLPLNYTRNEPETAVIEGRKPTNSQSKRTAQLVEGGGLFGTASLHPPGRR